MRGWELIRRNGSARWQEGLGVLGQECAGIILLLLEVYMYFFFQRDNGMQHIPQLTSVSQGVPVDYASNVHNYRTERHQW
jgi:hypothetical protein